MALALGYDRPRNSPGTCFLGLRFCTIATPLLPTLNPAAYHRARLIEYELDLTPAKPLSKCALLDWANVFVGLRDHLPSDLLALDPDFRVPNDVIVRGHDGAQNQPDHKTYNKHRKQYDHASHLY